MSASGGRRMRPSLAGALAVWMIVGGIFGAILGLMIGLERYAALDVGIATPYGYTSDSSSTEDDDSDPRVAWPLLGLAAGAVAGIAGVRCYDQLARDRVAETAASQNSGLNGR